MAELADLKKALFSGDHATPPGKRIPAPTPTSSGTSSSDKKSSRASGTSTGDRTPRTQADDSSGGEDVSEAAKNNRLRRLCEVKPSGRCHVPSPIHKRWAKGGSERMTLRDELEECGWDKVG